MPGGQKKAQPVLGGRAKQARGAVAPSWRRVRRDVTVFTWSVSGDSLAGHYANDPRSRSTPGKSQVLLRGSRVDATRSHRGLRPPAGKVEGGSNDWTWAVRVTFPLDVMTLDFRGNFVGGSTKVPRGAVHSFFPAGVRTARKFQTTFRATTV